MPDCSYCDATFEDDDAYADHLEAEHRGELGPIDRRRIGADADDDADDDWTGVVVIGLVLVLAAGAVAIFVFPSSGGDSSTAGEGEQPFDLGSVHYHGTITVVIDGQQVDFSRDRYQLQADPFHFEGGDGTRWHVHARGVTLAYAMGTLDIEVTDSTVTYRGTTYRDGDPNTTVTVSVDGDPVTPSDYVLQEGDRIRIVVEQS
jgi:sulfur carrier protein ThiS